MQLSFSKIPLKGYALKISINAIFKTLSQRGQVWFFSFYTKMNKNHGFGENHGNPFLKTILFFKMILP